MTCFLKNQIKARRLRIFEVYFLNFEPFGDEGAIECQWEATFQTVAKVAQTDKVDLKLGHPLVPNRLLAIVLISKYLSDLRTSSKFLITTKCYFLNLKTSFHPGITMRRNLFVQNVLSPHVTRDMCFMQPSFWPLFPIKICFIFLTSNLFNRFSQISWQNVFSDLFLKSDRKF